MNRIDRISAILIMLQARTLLKAQHVADRFDISLRTVYRDMRTLEEAGIPLIGNHGSGYTLVEGYKLPPLMFTQEEAIAFLMAEKLVERQTDEDSFRYFQSGMTKLRAVLRTSEKRMLEYADTSIAHIEPQRYRPAPQPGVLHPLVRATIERRIATLTYRTADNRPPSERRVEPVGICFMQRSWYMLGYCHLRADYRTFKLSRIQALTLTDEPFSRVHPSLSVLIEQLRADEPRYEVCIRIPAQSVGLVGDATYLYGLSDRREVDGEVELRFTVFSLDAFARWYMGIADCARILSPTALSDRVRELAQAALEALHHPKGDIC